MLLIRIQTMLFGAIQTVLFRCIQTMLFCEIQTVLFRGIQCKPQLVGSRFSNGRYESRKTTQQACQIDDSPETLCNRSTLLVQDKI